MKTIEGLMKKLELKSVPKNAVLYKNNNSEKILGYSKDLYKDNTDIILLNEKKINVSILTSSFFYREINELKLENNINCDKIVSDFYELELKKLSHIILWKESKDSLVITNLTTKFCSPYIVGYITEQGYNFEKIYLRNNCVHKTQNNTILNVVSDKETDLFYSLYIKYKSIWTTYQLTSSFDVNSIEKVHDKGVLQRLYNNNSFDYLNNKIFDEPSLIRKNNVIAYKNNDNSIMVTPGIKDSFGNKGVIHEPSIHCGIKAEFDCINSKLD